MLPSPPFGADWWSAVGSIASALGVLVALGVAMWQVLVRAAEARRAQAVQISAFLLPAGDGRNDKVVVINASATPVYTLAYRLRIQTPGLRVLPFRRGDLHQTGFAKVVAPGDWELATYGRDSDSFRAALFDTFAVEIAYRDSSNRWWVRDLTGQLKRIKVDPLDHLDVSRKHSVTASPFRYRDQPS